MKRAFTLIELLVVIGIIALLAALLLPSLAAAKKRGAQAACINNQHQLALGMKMYVGDNQDIFPGIASRLYGYHPEDWIYWRTNTLNYPPFEKSPILTALGSRARPGLRCPLDKDDSERFANVLADGYGPYLFSYSFTGYGLRNGANLGMSSVFEYQMGNVVSHLFRESSVQAPASKIMLAEEPGCAQDSGNGQSIIIDGRWIPASFQGMNVTAGDPLTTRHFGKADMAFADGHVQPVTPQFGADPQNSLPQP